MMRGRFTKYKSTSSLFYKNTSLADFNCGDDYFEFKIFPQISYTGRYFIESISEKDNKRTVFIVCKASLEVNSMDDIFYKEKYYLSIWKDFKKVAIFDKNFNGLIFKR